MPRDANTVITEAEALNRDISTREGHWILTSEC